MNTPHLPLQGSCLCGSVQVQVTALPILTFACHCRDCQKLSASAYSLSAMIPAEGFSVSGKLVIGGQRTAARQHHYCPQCMGFIFTRMQGVNSRINLRATVLDDLTWFVPFIELMTQEKIPWVNIPVEHTFARVPDTAEQVEALMEDYKTRLVGSENSKQQTDR